MVVPSRRQENLTRAQAEDAFATIKEHYRPRIRPGYGPQLIEDWPHSPSQTVHWAVVWPEGPEGWAINAAETGILENPFVSLAAVTGHVLALHPQP